ncbi:hypothetical protein MCOR27_007034 [Pyricularia oryzae]|nr:hypothetical protein MCOR01_002169 [Pyricularia oryzae]KAI6261264.1 hypothetical protein MCOR19_002438 [Pyricularia oryzae]KAI6275320.1 hypothetical protein MCOR27_007034 [Pyricularia oryzae]KAI6288233.1 hypothetical protein MCOR26_000241 [Pyricularia oryzae]KAI6316542.1 hypothetical protein MCOR34_004309 [Pyricularia oryzae]
MASSHSINVLGSGDSRYCFDPQIFLAYLEERFGPGFAFNLSNSNYRWQFELPRGELTDVRPLNRIPGDPLDIKMHLKADNELPALVCRRRRENWSGKWLEGVTQLCKEYGKS